MKIFFHTLFSLRRILKFTIKGHISPFTSVLTKAIAAGCTRWLVGELRREILWAAVGTFREPGIARNFLSSVAPTTAG
jgi:hypothetical protein